jgi:hypothetical protein
LAFALKGKDNFFFARETRKPSKRRKGAIFMDGHFSVKEFAAQYYGRKDQFFKDFIAIIGIARLQITQHFITRLVERFGTDDFHAVSDRVRESAKLAIRYGQDRSQIGRTMVVVDCKTDNPCLVTLFNTDSSPSYKKKTYCGKESIRRPRQYLRLHPGSVIRSRLGGERNVEKNPIATRAR